jgi:hypothetical protein
MIRLCMILGTLFKRSRTLFRETSESVPFCRHGQVTTAKSIVSTEHRNIEVPPLKKHLAAGRNTEFGWLSFKSGDNR